MILRPLQSSLRVFVPVRVNQLKAFVLRRNPKYLCVCVRHCWCQGLTRCSPVRWEMSLPRELGGGWITGTG